MGDISSYTARTSVIGSDRLFIATSGSPDIDSCTVDQINGAGLAIPALYFSGHPGALGASEIVWFLTAVTPLSVPAGLTSWIFTSGVAAASDTTLTLVHNGTNVGSVFFASGSRVGAVTPSGSFSINISDTLSLVGAASPDSGLAQIFSSLYFGPGATISIFNPFDKNASLGLSSDNLTAIGSGASYESVRSNIGRNSGLLYFEETYVSVSTAACVGLANSSEALTNRGGDSVNSIIYNPFEHGIIYNGSGALDLAASTGDVTGWAVNFTSKDIWARKNGGLWNADAVADPVAGVHGLNSATYFNGALNALFGSKLFVWASCYSTSEITVNFGASAFANAPPSGYSAWT